MGLGYIWHSDEIIDKDIDIIKRRMYDIFQQDCNEQIELSSKCSLYKYINEGFGLQKYLTKSIGTQKVKEISKIRMSSHKLNIERGRYNNTDRCRRICTSCNSGDIEDEYHFIIKCETFKDIRSKCIKSYYFQNPSMFKFVQLMKTDNIKDLSNLAKFIRLSNKKRESLA